MKVHPWSFSKLLLDKALLTLMLMLVFEAFLSIVLLSNMSHTIYIPNLWIPRLSDMCEPLSIKGLTNRNLLGFFGNWILSGECFLRLRWGFWRLQLWWNKAVFALWVRVFPLGWIRCFYQYQRLCYFKDDTSQEFFFCSLYLTYNKVFVGPLTLSPGTSFVSRSQTYHNV